MVVEARTSKPLRAQDRQTPRCDSQRIFSLRVNSPRDRAKHTRGQASCLAQLVKA